MRQRPKWARRSCGAALVALALVRPGVASAQATGADAAGREQARVHFERGVALGDAGRWLEAVRELEAARAIRATPPVYYDLGMGYRALGRNRDAIDALQRYLAGAGDAAPRERVAQVQGIVRALRAGLATVTVRVAPVDAEVSLDRVPLVSLERPVVLDPGPHTLRARASGYRDMTRAIDAHAGERFAFDVSLVPVASATRLLIDANVRAAAIEIDGATVSFGSAEEYVRPGAHRVQVHAAGYAPFQRAITALAGTTATVRVTLERPRGLLASPWLWLSVSAGAVLVAAGIVALASGPLAPFRGPLANVDVSPAGAR